MTAKKRFITIGVDEVGRAAKGEPRRFAGRVNEDGQI